MKATARGEHIHIVTQESVIAKGAGRGRCHMKGQLSKWRSKKEIDGAILLGFPTTGYAGYRIRTKEDSKAHGSIIQGKISQDHAKTPTMVRLCSL